MTLRFVPPPPPRGAGPVAVWRGFVGERARTAVYGWSEQAFTADHIRRKVFGINVHMPLTPQAAQHVLLDNAANYVKPGLVKKILGRTIGEGLLTADGALWRDQRRIVAASFTPPAVDALVPVFADVARTASGRWAAGTRDMALEATTATMQVISNALFSGDPRLTSETAMRHITDALEGVSEARLQVILGLPIVPLSRKGRKAHRGQAYLRRTLAALVDERLAGGVAEDFLADVIRALAERFPARQARELAVDNAATFYLAGHETTANAITWTLFLLSEQPALQEQAAAEARAALAAGCRVGWRAGDSPPCPAATCRSPAWSRCGPGEACRYGSSRAGKRLRRSLRMILRNILNSDTCPTETQICAATRGLHDPSFRFRFHARLRAFRAGPCR